MAKIPIALQLYSVRDDCAKDLPGTLDAVAKAGYAGVEFAGYHGRSAKELRRMLDDRGLKCCGTHTGIDTLLGDELSKTVEYNQILGNPYLIVPGLPAQYIGSRANWYNTAQVFNEISARARPQGMYTGYHNHTIEFQPLDGELPWDTFFANTTKDVVMQVDIGNCLHGGGDPYPCFEKYPGRALTVHAKEHSKSNDKAIIGEGDVKWDEFFSLCETVGGTRWYIVEQESYAYPPIECADRCLQNLHKMGK